MAKTLFGLGRSLLAAKQIKIINFKMLGTHKQTKQEKKNNYNWPGHLGQVPKNNNKGETKDKCAKSGK